MAAIPTQPANPPVNAMDWQALSEHEGPEGSPGYLLWRASLEWRRSIERALAPLELTQAQFVVLASIGWLTREGKPVRQAEIGRHSGIDPNTMSQILGGLEKRKLLSRRQLAHDRGKFPRLTAAGQALVARAVALVEAVDRQFFAVLGPDIAVAINVFSRLFHAAT